MAPPVYPLLHRSLLRFMTLSSFMTLSRGSRTQAETRVMNPQAGQHLEDGRGGQEVDERGGGVGVHEHAERKAAPLQRGLKLRPGGGRGGGRGQALGPSGEALLAAAALFPYHGASSNRVNADRARTREMHDGVVLLRGHDMPPFYARGWGQPRRLEMSRAGWLHARTATRAHSRPRAQSAGCSPACACRTKRAARSALPPARAPAPWPAAVCSGLKLYPDMPGVVITSGMRHVLHGVGSWRAANRRARGARVGSGPTAAGPSLHSAAAAGGMSRTLSQCGPDPGASLAARPWEPAPMRSRSRARLWIRHRSQGRTARGAPRTATAASAAARGPGPGRPPPPGCARARPRCAGRRRPPRSSAVRGRPSGAHSLGRAWQATRRCFHSAPPPRVPGLCTARRRSRLGTIQDLAGYAAVAVRPGSRRSGRRRRRPTRAGPWAPSPGGTTAR
jgi:hypothetical protein